MSKLKIPPINSVLAVQISEAERLKRLKTMAHWSLPLVSLCIWWGMLTTMLGLWGAGKMDYLAYKDHNRALVYVSTIGSEGLKPLFVCGSFMMGIVAMISTVAERMLGHRERLIEDKRQWERASNWVTIITSFLGYINLFLVAIFDCRDHYILHVIALVLFLGFLGVSSFTIVAEFYFLDPEYVYYRRLQISYFFRMLWSILEVGLIIAFTVYSLSNIKREGCLLEWIVAYLFGIHLLLMIYVLCPLSTEEILEIEDHFGNRIENAMFALFGFSSWIKAYQKQCQQVRAADRFMKRHNNTRSFLDGGNLNGMNSRGYHNEKVDTSENGQTREYNYYLSYAMDNSPHLPPSATNMEPNSYGYNDQTGPYIYKEDEINSVNHIIHQNGYHGSMGVDVEESGWVYEKVGVSRNSKEPKRTVTDISDVSQSLNSSRVNSWCGLVSGSDKHG